MRSAAAILLSLLLSSPSWGDVGGIDVDAAVRRMQSDSLTYSAYQSQHTAPDARLPEMGAQGSSVLTVQEEEFFGRFYFREARKHLNVIADPVLDSYIRSLGSRLVTHANNVRFPFNFFLVQDPEINAAAFLGGNVRVNTGLVLFTDNESQLASVLAHEITHVTQRHLVRFLEAAARRQNITLGAFVGGMILALINPAVGMAAIQTTLGLNMQAQINFTRKDELEADHIGIDLLGRAGFDPSQMAVLFSRIASTAPSAGRLPQGLMSHPFPETRVAEARSRAERMPRPRSNSEQDFLYARARIHARFAGLRGDQVVDYHTRALKGARSPAEKNAALYGITLGYLLQKKPGAAEEHFRRITPSSSPFLLDTEADIGIMAGRAKETAARLRPRYQTSPGDQTAALNYAVALNAAGDYNGAVTVLRKFTVSRPDSVIAWELLAQNYRKLGRMYEHYCALAEASTLAGDYDRSNGFASKASRHARSKLEKARLDAMVVRNERYRISDVRLSKK